MLVLFACKDPSPLYKSSKTRNHLKPENLETLFLLSALKMPITSVTSYQAEIKYLEEANSPLIFRFCNCIFIFQHSNVFLFNVGNKIFCFYKKWVLLFWTRVHFNGGSQVLQNFEAWLLINWRGSLKYLEFLLGEGTR